MTGLGPVTGDRYTTGRAFATSDGHVKHISGWPDVHRQSAAADGPTCDPSQRNGAGLLRFTSTSGLERDLAPKPSGVLSAL